MADQDRSGDIANALMRHLQSHQPDATACILETHISWVVLHGRFAYKIKKAIDLGFLNYTDPKKRAHFCEQEVSLNKRLAPDIYLDSVALGGSFESLCENGQPVLEHAVKMNRFEQDAILDAPGADADLTENLLKDLAERLHHFHDQAAVIEQNSRLGLPEEVCIPVNESLTKLDELLHLPADRELLHSIRQWCRTEWTHRRDAFQRRKDDGHIRACHGDLHLRNMVLINGRIEVFDCIEFSERLRWIDTISDIAFLAMDLFHRNKHSLAWSVLNDYLEASGDYEGLAVLRYYLVYRACVRAKVAAILACEEHGADASEDARSYLQLADALTRPSSPCLLVMTHGLSGSGKSTGSLRLCREIGMIRCRSDVERKRLRSNDPLYSAAMTARTYNRLESICRLGLASGFSMLADATFLTRAQREPFHELAKTIGCHHAILWFRSDDDTLKNRLQLRQIHGGEVSDAGPDVLAIQQDAMEPLSQEEQGISIEISSLQGIEKASALLKTQ
jgi:aminoglycoside phosphotransferase family enzyme/predicted kinase